MKKHIGIDLGTTNCCMAWMNGDEVVVYRDEHERTRVPSIVAQDRKGEILVGWRARASKDAVYRHGFAKRALGSTQQFPLRDRSVDAVSIGAYLLEHLKERAEKELGCEVAAVITVPAHFQEIHREETRRAAEITGLEVIELLQEPIAAAIAYYHEGATRRENRPKEETILVYDLGGGTMDATVCVREGEHVKIGALGRAYDGDKFLGGVDFDKALVGLAAPQLKSQAFEAGTLGDDLPTSLWLWDLMTSAERCKQDLSREREVQWSQEFLRPETGAQASLNMWVTRPQFEEVIAHLVDKTLNYCDQALLSHAATLLPGPARERSELLRTAVQRLDRIILVGGSTLVPCIREKVRAHFAAIDSKPLEIQSFRPYECVAIGAAIYARTRSARSAYSADQIIQWTSAPQCRVGADVGVHPELMGIVSQRDGVEWRIEVATPFEVLRTEIRADGHFRVPAFRLDVGENQIVATVRDREGQIRGQQAQTITRGGITISDPGLAHEVCVRLVDGLRQLIPAGTRSGSLHNAEFYVNDTSGALRAPLYEGHYPIGVIEFASDAQPGTPITFRTLYDRGKLEVEIQVGRQEPLKSHIELESLPYPNERNELARRFRDLIQRTEFLLAKLPREGALVSIFRRKWEILRFDIETEFSNPIVLDLSRIDDRIRQLDVLNLQIQGFSTTSEGLRQLLDETRQEVVDQGGNPELLKDLREIEANIPNEEDPEILAALRTKLHGVRRNLYLQNPPEMTPALMDYQRLQIAVCLERIREDVGNDVSVLEKVRRIEEAIEKLMASGADGRLLFHRLWMYEQEYVNPLYEQVVIRKSQRGLMRGAPR